MAVSHPPPPTLPQDMRMGPPALYELREEVANLLNRKDKRGFPGAQPVSFSRQHLAELQRQDYYVCEKSDGIRCLMYLTGESPAPGEPPEETAYLIDRKNDYYQVKGLHFPRNAEEPQAFFTKTILDGELVNDREADGSIQLRYLVFDCLVCNGTPLTERVLDKRLGYFKDFVYQPYQKLFWQLYPAERQYQPFLIEMKSQQFSYATEFLFRQSMPTLKHGNDGLIFTCRASHYHFGTDTNILKWKPSDENSIDFRLHLDIPIYDPGDGSDPFPDYEVMPKFNLAVSADGGWDQQWGELFMTEEEWEKLKGLKEPLDERLVECYMDGQGRWRFMRFRDDKKGPNHISTAKSVIESIKDPVTEEMLIGVAPDVRRAWKSRSETAKA